MAVLLCIPSHSRRAPIDPLAEVKARMTAQLREDVAVMRMVSELERIVDEELVREGS